MRKKCMLAALAVFSAALFISPEQGYSQVLSYMKDKRLENKKKKKGPQQPIVITSNSMDIDMGEDKATFIGNVEVDGEEMNIKCHKMIIYMEDVEVEPEEEAEETEAEEITETKTATETKEKPENKTAEKTETKTATETKENQENKTAQGQENEEQKASRKKEISKIKCFGDVVILRKVTDLKEKARGEQKALADQAVYDVKTGKIVLTGRNPKILRGDDMVSGEKITIWKDSERMEVEGGSRGSKFVLNSDQKTKEEEEEGDKVKDAEADEKDSSAENSEKNSSVDDIVKKENQAAAKTEKEKKDGKISAEKAEQQTNK